MNDSVAVAIEKALDRAEISFTLLTHSMLCIGGERPLNTPQPASAEDQTGMPRNSGDGNNSVDGNTTSGDSRSTNSTIIECICSATGQPIIPGSSLRGLLVQAVNTRIANLRAIDKKDSTAKLLEDALGHQQRASAIAVMDAIAISAKKCHSTRVAIDPITGSASHGQLFSYQCVAAGARFHVRIKLRNPSRAAMTPLLAIEIMAALSSLNHIQIGGGKSTGNGVVSIENSFILKTLTPDKFTAWLNGDGQAELANFYEDAITVVPSQVTGPLKILPLTLVPLEPILVNDPLLAEETRPEQDHSSTRKVVSHNLKASQRGKPKQPEHECVVPGSSLKGVCKAAMRRILNSIDELDTNQFLALFFGSTTTGTGLLHFYDATGKVTGVESRTMVKIDRHTGLASPFRAEGLWADVLDSKLGVNSVQLESADKVVCLMLLLFMLRDLLQQDIKTGWGGTRGFGALYGYIGPEDPLTGSIDETQYFDSIIGRFYDQGQSPGLTGLCTRFEAGVENAASPLTGSTSSQAPEALV